MLAGYTTAHVRRFHDSIWSTSREAASVVTCLDGYQMARQGGRPGLGIAAFGSFIAGPFDPGLDAAGTPSFQDRHSIWTAGVFHPDVLGSPS